MDVQIAVEIFKERQKLEIYNELDLIIRRINKKCGNDLETNILALEDIVNGLEEIIQIINKYELKIDEIIKEAKVN